MITIKLTKKCDPCIHRIVIENVNSKSRERLNSANYTEPNSLDKTKTSQNVSSCKTMEDVDLSLEIKALLNRC